MGLLSAIFGSNKKTTTNTTHQTSSTTNYNDSRKAVSEGVLIDENATADFSDNSVSNYTNIVTDGGAIEGAFGVSRAALESGRRMLEDTLNANTKATDQVFGVVTNAYEEGLGFAEGTYRDGLDFAGRSQDAVLDIYGQSLEAIQEGANESRRFAESIVDTVSESAKDTDTQNTQKIVDAVKVVAITVTLAVAARSLFK